MDVKICGVKNSKTLSYIVNHQNPPKFIGFICNYPKSKRNLSFAELSRLLKIKKNSFIKYVSVLVNPTSKTLNKINQLNFDYLQLYDVNPKKTLDIKKRFKVKIITAITVRNLKDVMLYKKYTNISDIILFDGKGYEKSLGFKHSMIKNVPKNITVMLAGNIKYDDKLNKFNKITDIIDLSGNLETNGEKDILKINILLKNLKNLKNETKKKNTPYRST